MPAPETIVLVHDGIANSITVPLAGVSGHLARGWELDNPDDAQWLIPTPPSPAVDVVTVGELEDEESPARGVLDGLYSGGGGGLTAAAIAGQLEDPESVIGGAAHDTFVPRWKAATAVLAGALAVSPTGQTIQRIANGTTGATYDTAEAALWTVATGSGGSAPIVNNPVSARIDIVTAGKAAIVSKENYLACTIAISGVPGVADYAGVGQIRGRGNNTWQKPKKPYKLKLPAKVSLMGMPAFDDWALLANYNDHSHINTALAFELGYQADGLDWTPRYEYAELYLNGEYNGLYQLAETAKRGTDRVNVPKVGTTGLALTGGYLIEGDTDYVINGDLGFNTAQGVKIVFDDPDGTNGTQAAAVIAKVQAFEDALFGGSFTNPTTGYLPHIDRDSFIDHYLIEDLAVNVEAAWHSSQKFYRTRDTDSVPGKFFMGPLWDFDQSFGADFYGIDPPIFSDPTEHFARSTTTGAGPGATWIIRMFEDPTFAAAAQTRWLAMLARLLNADTGYVAMIDALTARVAAAALADQEEWEYAADWSLFASAKKAFLAQRMQWMNSVLVTATGVPTVAPTLRVVAPRADGADLAWTPVTGLTGADDFVLRYRVQGDATWTTYGDDTSIALTGTVDGLDPETTYELAVAAANGLGTGPFSTAVVVTTLEGGGPAGTLSDDFNRADNLASLGTTPVGNGTWVAVNGTWGVTSNHAATISGTSNAIATVSNGLTNGTVSVRVTTPDDGTGLIWRCTDANNFYLLAHTVSGLTAFKRVAGTYSAVGTIPPEVFVTAGDVIAAEANGTTHTLYVNDVEVASFTDASLSTGDWGMRADSTGGRLDDFTVAPL